MNTMFRHHCLLHRQFFFRILIQEKDYFGTSPAFLMVSSHGYLIVSKSFTHADCGVFWKAGIPVCTSLKYGTRNKKETLVSIAYCSPCGISNEKIPLLDLSLQAQNSSYMSIQQSIKEKKRKTEFR